MSDVFCRCREGHPFRITRRRGFAALFGAGLAGAFGSVPEEASAGARLSPPRLEDEDSSCASPSPRRRKGDFPFGAVIVRDSEAIARGRNLGKPKTIRPRMPN